VSPRSSVPEVLAGGAVLWRSAPADGSLQIALVHRPRYDDWSLPKGKLDSGEHLLTCAAREVEEETGFRAVLGRPLGEQRYPIEVKGEPATKVVRYWAARALDGGFTANEEVDELEWLSVEGATSRLTHVRDREMVERLAERPHDTSPVVLVRHAKAGNSKAWQADDRLRPLEAEGRAQATAVCASLPVFGVERVLSADLTRCVETVRPLADSLGVPVEIEPALGEAAYSDDPDRALRRLVEIGAQGRSAVLCSQGDVIPPLVADVTRRYGVPLEREPASRKGSAWVLAFSGDRLVEAEYFDDLMPAR
jgi:8-oxo-(d)GTP phosphatase